MIEMTLFSAGLVLGVSSLIDTCGFEKIAIIIIIALLL